MTEATSERLWPPLRAKGGYSLVELAIVLSIMGLVAVLAIPSIRRTMSRYQVADAGGRLFSQLRAARMHAISGSRTVYISLDTAGKALVTSTDSNDNGTIEPDESETLSLASASGPVLTANSSGGSFRSDGRLVTSNSYLKVTITKTGFERYVYSFSGGHVELSDRPLD